MNSLGEKVEVNFGNKPFAYNIELENILQDAHSKDLLLQQKNSPIKDEKAISDHNKLLSSDYIITDNHSLTIR